MTTAPTSSLFAWMGSISEMCDAVGIYFVLFCSILLWLHALVSPGEKKDCIWLAGTLVWGVFPISYALIFGVLMMPLWLLGMLASSLNVVKLLDAIDPPHGKHVMLLCMTLAFVCVTALPGLVFRKKASPLLKAVRLQRLFLALSLAAAMLLGKWPVGSDGAAGPLRFLTWLMGANLLTPLALGLAYALRRAKASLSEQPTQQKFSARRISCIMAALYLLAFVPAWLISSHKHAVAAQALQQKIETEGQRIRLAMGYHFYHAREVKLDPDILVQLRSLLGSMQWNPRGRSDYTLSPYSLIFELSYRSDDVYFAPEALGPAGADADSAYTLPEKDYAAFLNCMNSLIASMYAQADTCLILFNRELPPHELEELKSILASLKWNPPHAKKTCETDMKLNRDIILMFNKGQYGSYYLYPLEITVEGSSTYSPLSLPPEEFERLQNWLQQSAHP